MGIRLRERRGIVTLGGFHARQRMKRHQTVDRTLETPRSKVGDAVDGRSPGSRVRAFRSAFPVIQSNQWRVVSVGSSLTVAGAATAFALNSRVAEQRTVFPFHPTSGNRPAKSYRSIRDVATAN